MQTPLNRLYRRGANFVLPLLLMQLLIAAPVAAREVVDMAGRRIELPEPLERVYVASPPENLLAVAIDPSLMVGLNLPLQEQDRDYLPASLEQLPIIGGFYGLGHTPNLEVLLRTRPQLVICWQENALTSHFDDVMKQFGVPLAYVNLQKLQDYPRDMRLMGHILGRPQRAEQLASHAEEILQEILPRAAAIPEAQRLRVYYAQGADGLRTDGGGTWHAELIDLAAGRNVHPGDPDDLFGMQQISLEQVLLYRPEVILVQDPSFYQRVFTAPGWRDLPAVKNRRVYLIPATPFNWFDRPPSFMRLLGLQWLAQLLYPKTFPLDMERRTADFYRLFLQVQLSPGQLSELLGNGEGPTDE